MKWTLTSQPRRASLGRRAGAWQTGRMKRALTFALPSILLACDAPPEMAPANIAKAQASNEAAPPGPIAQPFLAEEKNDLIDFHFGWSAEAGAVPQLVDRFQAQLAKIKAELIAGAKQEKAWREKENLDFNGFMSSTDYTTAGQSPGLLSLSVAIGSYTGGAHGNHGVGAILWDRQRQKEIGTKELFAEQSNRDRLLTQPWCDALGTARAAKRNGETSNGIFDDCPKLDEIAIVPTDKDGNGRFDRLMFTAAPYVAGPYAEGSYEIDLPVTPDLIATLKSEYRDSFEAAQPQ
jgi:hypothetical protein